MNALRMLMLSLFSSAAMAHPFTECIDGMADFYPCDNVDLLTRMHIEHLGGQASTAGSDIWGWTDAGSGREFALMTFNDSTAFVEVTVPTAPVYLGRLATSSSQVSVWRDVKVYADHAFIVADNVPNHGIQIFDLTQLLTVSNPPVEFSETAIYSGIENAHNIVINEDNATAFAVGSDTCAGGLHMLDISNPTSPVFTGCFSSDGYTHDAQCVIYQGSDSEHIGKEICVNSNEDTVTIVDVTDKNNPLQLSRNNYSGSSYTHQGWLTEDHRYYLMDDELDEQNSGFNTRTYIWDFADLDNPQVLGHYTGNTPSIDHNLYIRGQYAYLSNYRSGLRILDISDIGNAQLNEVAFFDTYPDSDSASFSGAWSNYPYFDSGTVIVSDIQGGLFILGPKNLCPAASEPPQNLQAIGNGDNSVQLNWDLDLGPDEAYTVYRSYGDCSNPTWNAVGSGLLSAAFTDSTVSGQVDVSYAIAKHSTVSNCQSQPSQCVTVQTTGACTAPPIFSGLATAVSAATQQCGVELSWPAAQSRCGQDVGYQIHRADSADFEPAPANLLIAGLNGTIHTDHSALPATEHHYIVRAIDAGSGAQDDNHVALAASATGPLTDGSFSTGAEVGDPVMDTFNTRHQGWHISEDVAQAGLRSFFSTSSSGLCVTLTSPPLALTAAQSTLLNFHTRYHIEERTATTAWDGGLVEISSDGGNNWQRPALTPNYTHTMDNTSDACALGNGTPVFSGPQDAWQQHSLDLSAFAGQTVQLRWVYSSDNFVNEEGWFVDDIDITHVQVPGQCSAAVDLIFANGYE